MDKNGFVFLPMFFAGQLSNLKYLEEAIIGFITFSFAASYKVATIIFIYIMVNIAYCIRLKQLAIIDMVVVSFGFVLRIILGGVGTSTWISPWFYGKIEKIIKFREILI